MEDNVAVQATLMNKSPRAAVTSGISHDELAMYDAMARELEDLDFGQRSLIEDTLHHFMN